MDIKLLEKYGISFPQSMEAKSLGEALDAAKKIGFPVVMKAISQEVLHKSDKGGVILGIKTKAEAEKAYHLITERYRKIKLDSVLVQKMAGKGGVEIIVGGKRDPQFGQLIMLGMGGIFVEVLKDVSFRICPIKRDDALQMIHELKSYPILAGARGRKPIKEEALIDTLISVSKLLEKENPAEFDLNPVLADHKGCTAVDLRILY